MDICKMLTLSTAHITKRTAERLDETSNPMNLSVYAKGEYGWYIYDWDDRDTEIPDDLRDIFRFAQEHDCQVVCLDCDGDESDALPTYEWYDGTAKRCPKCGSQSFLVTAHVTQDWIVDGNGNFLSCENECVETTHQPDDDDIWTCNNCGFNAPGKEFNIK